MDRVRCEAAAKINLHLEVLGRRSDGFHELRTLFASIDLRDELLAERLDDGRLELVVEPEGSAPSGPDNLVLRAARELRGAAGTGSGARLVLHKRIPAGAGLGGGSADAAAALVLLSALWEVDLEPEETWRMAAGLGSDVPFFLTGGLALGVGRGDEVVPLPDPAGEVHLAVAWPGVAVSTPEVYGRLEAPLTWRAPEVTVRMAAAGGAVPPDAQWMRNDLEPVVLAGWPQVAAIREAMTATEYGAVRVTGSGGAVFGVFGSRREAEVAARRALAAGAAAAHVGRTLGREEARIRAL